MKKKNIFKKLLSVVLSAATTFSLLTLPAHATIPAGDMYSITTTTLYRYYCGSQSTQQLVVSNDDDMFPGTSTYDFLDADQLPNGYFGGGADLQGIIGEDDRQPLPPNPFWDMTVLILVGVDTDNDGGADVFAVASGFLVDKNVMVTAMHAICPTVVNINQIKSVTVFHGINNPAMCGDVASLIAGADSAHIESVTYDPRYLTARESGGDETAYDWCIVTLGARTGTNPNIEDNKGFDSYYLDCDIALSSIETSEICVIGYSQDGLYSGEDTQYQFLRQAGMGEALAYDGVILTHDADTLQGASGGPLISEELTSVAVGYGIHLKTLSEDGMDPKEGIENYARAITPEIYNAIVTIMEES